MIRRIRFDWSLPLVTVTELHVGTGQSRAADSAEISRGISCEVATYVRDNHGAPCIPGATLKGAFRDGNDDDAANQLFGQSHAKSDPPPVFASAVVSFGAFLPPPTTCPPIVRLRTAVSGGTGASEANKLFAEEWVPPGTRLNARFRLEVRQRDQRHGQDGGISFAGESESDLKMRAERLRQAFEVRLARFCRPEGVAIAADKSDGMGRVRFDLNIFTEQSRSKTAPSVAFVQLKFERRELTTDGWSEAHTLFARCDLPPATNSLIEIPLACPGPYIARGGIRTVTEGTAIRKITLPERDATCMPRVHPSGVSGALRNRAEWLVALARLRDPNAYQDAARATSAGTATLSVVKRLFGDEGWRGSLNVDVSGVSRRGTSVYPFVALDPITQAPAKDALFKIETDFGVKATLRISPYRPLQADETALFTALETDIATHGLHLGGGSSRGWGWFNIHPTDPARTSPTTRICPDPTPEMKDRLPDSRITLPYRMIKADPSKALMPEQSVAVRFAARTLLSDPIPEGLCGWLDVSWCIETAILIGDGADPVSPQMLDGVPVLPGSTLRGLIRSIVETVTQARFGRLHEATSIARIGRLAKPADVVAGGAVFEPDFAQALFGHVIESSSTPQNRTTHQEHHLKSRLAFGYAGLTNFTPRLIDQSARIMQLSGPSPNAVFYDEPGRKTYYATGGDASVVNARLDANQKPRAKSGTITNLRFLNPPAKDDPLVFRGRIRFHNVTTAELGALVWAVTMDDKPFLRHRIGHARAYGAGRGFADDLHLHIEGNKEKTPLPPSEHEIEYFGLHGHSFTPALQAFGRLLHSKDLFYHQTVDELKAAADPAIGNAIRVSAGIGPTGLAYQISDGFKGPNAAMATNIRAMQDGRLAAMLKPKP